ncbi:protein DpdG [Thalassotalea ponticola]|uniref:protein DpdG n=1 Tax=Thalassotalea ponticola TaxID=1523392 RepID=UPI0025B42B5A|nr:protein DpdG [Thalassotalea ponticola]MDN3652325.1 protein DpdG [Thalassotalea ponticola]
MAIINNAHRGSHIPTLILIDELLLKFNTKKPESYLPRSKILGPCMPESLYRKGKNDEFEINTNAQKKMRESLDFWTEHGLWESTQLPDGEVGYQSNWFTSTKENLPKRILDVISKHFFADKKLKMSLEELYSNDELPKDFSTFIFAICFFLYQEESNFQNQIFLTKSFARQLMSDSVIQGNVKVTFNASEEANVMEYGHLLGFFEVVDKDLYIVDPTRFIQWYLSEVFMEQNELDIQEFLDRLNLILPIFDTGPYQESLPNYLNKKRPVGNLNDGSIQMSSALSLALYRLEKKNLLRLEVRSDSRFRFNLTIPTSVSKQVTHLRRTSEVTK